MGNQIFQFDFDSEDDLQKVLSKRPCHYNKWSFALERWAPHIGDSFPNTMTFWVTALGIPTHFWLDPIFRALGRRLGNVGLVEEKTAKFQVEINAELPLKFALRVQAPLWGNCSSLLGIYQPPPMVPLLPSNIPRRRYLPNAI